MNYLFILAVLVISGAALYASLWSISSEKNTAISAYIAYSALLAFSAFLLFLMISSRYDIAPVYWGLLYVTYLLIMYKSHIFERLKK